MPDDPFTVSVHGGFAEHGVWVLDARLDWRDGPSPEGSALLGHGRLALLRATAREGAPGRALGTTRARVHMPGHTTEGITIGEPDLGDAG